MSETTNKGKNLLTNDDVCLYCTPTRDGGIYYDTKKRIFFEYEKGLERDYMFVLTKQEAKEELQALKPFLTEEQIEKCKEIWSDF